MNALNNNPGCEKEYATAEAPRPPSLTKGFLAMGGIAIIFATTTYIALSGETSGHEEPSPASCPPPSATASHEINAAAARDTNALRHKYLQTPSLQELPKAERALAANALLREHLAKDYHVTLVGQQAVDRTLHKIVKAKSVAKIIKAIDSFTTKELGIPTDFAIPQSQQENDTILEINGFTTKSNVDPEKVEYMQRNAARIVQDLALLPKELVAAADVDANLIADTMFELTPEGAYGIAGFVETANKSDVHLAGGTNLGDDISSVTIHEYSHRWHYKACAGPPVKDPSYEGLNPRTNFAYDGQKDGYYSDEEQSATESEYSTYSVGEDFAESTSIGIRSTFSVAQTKPIVGQKWGISMARLNDIAKGEPGSYFVAYSGADNYGANIAAPKMMSVKHANADSVGTAN